MFGQVSSVSIDERGHAWILQRPTTIRSDQKARAMAAPPVLEFDESGNFVQGWGGPGEGFDWVESEHGIYVDPKSNLYTTEVQDGKRAQKLVFKGLVSVPVK